MSTGVSIGALRSRAFKAFFQLLFSMVFMRLLSSDCVSSSCPKSFGIIAAGDELANAFDHAGAVFAIGDTKPRIVRAQNFHPRLPAHDQIIDRAGDEAFGFYIHAVQFEESLEMGLQ